MSKVEPKTELLIQKEIRLKEDDLVTAIQKALDQKSSYGNLEESQFRNLLRVSETTESPEVIKNFLRYQLGRDEKWGKGINSLAEAIVKHIDKDLKDFAKAIVKENSLSTKQEKAIHIQLIRLYLGYGSRYLKYLKVK